MEEMIEDFANRWKFNWEVMDVLISAKSSIDLDELCIRNLQEATEFVRNYGYDPDNSREARQIHAIIVESLDFISKFLIPKKWNQGIRPPEKILKTDDVRTLLMLASEKDPKFQWEQAWACGILRVMHTIAHMDSLNRMVDLDEARAQIMGRFQSHVFRNVQKHLYFGKPGNAVPIEKVEWKHSKSRESIILKLLHKKANVAETIYDLLGVRIISKNLADVMVVVKYLREFHLITFTNCIPGRSRNNLMDVENFKHNIDTLRDLLCQNRLSPEEFLSMVQKVTLPLKATSTANPHSNRNYRSVQLTCRHFIRFLNPYMAWRDGLEKLVLRDTISPDLRACLGEILFLSRNPVKEWEGNYVMGFFPFEVHILDLESYAQNTIGDANHQRYKLSQVRAARRRVLSRVLNLKPPKGL